LDLGCRLLDPWSEGRSEIQGVHPSADLHEAAVRCFDDEIDRIADEVGTRSKAFRLVKQDKKLVRYCLPLQPDDPDEPVWSVIRTLSKQIGEELTNHLRAVADANPLLKGIIDRIDFNATTHGQRDIDDDPLAGRYSSYMAQAPEPLFRSYYMAQAPEPLFRS
jgi:hypothetical protein